MRPLRLKMGRRIGKHLVPIETQLIKRPPSRLGY